MRLEQYLYQRGESENRFAGRSGVSQQAINKICKRGGCRLDTALKIVAAAHGRVAFADLVKREEHAAG